MKVIDKYPGRYDKSVRRAAGVAAGLLACGSVVMAPSAGAGIAREHTLIIRSKALKTGASFAEFSPKESIDISDPAKFKAKNCGPRFAGYSVLTRRGKGLAYASISFEATNTPPVSSEASSFARPASYRRGLMIPLALLNTHR